MRTPSSGGWSLIYTRRTRLALKDHIGLAYLGNLEVFTGTAEFENEKTRSEQLGFKEMLPGPESWRRTKGSNGDISWLELVWKEKAYLHGPRPYSLGKYSLGQETYTMCESMVQKTCFISRRLVGNMESS